jgi:y4mF family transcriptional regulator
MAKKDTDPFTGREAVNTPARLGEIVRQTRKASGLKQAEAAAMCRVGPRFLSDLENGKPSLHLGKVLQVLSGFGLSVVLKRKELSDERGA